MGGAFARDARAAAADLLGTVARDAVAACDPAEAVRRAVAVRGGQLIVCGRPLHLRARGRILVLSFGKAAAGMLAGFLKRVREADGRRVVQALAVAPHAAPPASAAPGRRPARPARRPAEPPIVPRDLPATRYRLAGLRGDHPVPLGDSFAAGRRALQFAARAGAADDVVFLASGGGSAVLAAPLPGLLTPREKSALHRVLLATGAPISAINTVRKHLSAIKGGRLAVAARRAKSQSTLVLCDVDPERYADVASGPSVPDRTTLDDLVRVIDRYGIAPAVPVKVLEGLRRGGIPDTPKPKDAVFRRSRAEMVLSNKDLRNGAVRAGLARGLPAEAVPTELTGSIQIAVEMVARAIETAPPGTRLLVLGGEVLTTPRAAAGAGGRAQEFALRLALRMAGLGSRPWAFLAAGSDGLDGNSAAAGAFADATTLERARAARLDPERVLRDGDSHRLFARLGDAFVTGPTGTNVRDLYLLLTGPVPAPLAPLDPFRGGAPDPAPWPEESES
jgi:glycerate-2-kinase